MEIVNKVEQSGIVSFDLEDYFFEGKRMDFDMKEHLFHGLILKEKDFRDFIKNNDWSVFNQSAVAIYCSTDAIVPTWAYMLVSNRLSGIASYVFFGKKEEMETALYMEAISQIDVNAYKDKRVVVKGCSDKNVPVSAYVEITRKLSPVVKSLMFGEPCSTVPIFKRTTG